MAEAVIIDVSKWQGLMNWEIAKPKIHGAILRTTEGTSGVDPQFDRNKAEVRRLDIPWGGYHDFKGDKDPRKQARWFAGKIGHFTPTGQYEFDINLFPAVDVEKRPSTWIVAGKLQVFTKQDMFNVLTKFINEFKIVTGIYPWIYTRATWWDVNMPRTDFDNICPAWLADYRKVVSPWVPLDYQKRGWKMWQYLADGDNLGRKYGGQCDDIDISKYFGGLDQFNKDFNLSLKPIEGDVTPPTPPPPPPPPAPITKVVPVLKTVGGSNVRDNIIRGKNSSSKTVFPTSKILFSLPAGSPVEVLAEVIDGQNIWVRVGQRQVMAKVYDGKIYLA